MNTLRPFTRTSSFLQRAATKRTTTLYRSFSSTVAANDAPSKLTEQEVAASVRLLTYQGTPFPWVAVSGEINWLLVVEITVAEIGLIYLPSFCHCFRQKKIEQSQKRSFSQTLIKRGVLWVERHCWQKKWTIIQNGWTYSIEWKSHWRHTIATASPNRYVECAFVSELFTLHFAQMKG